MVQSVNFLPSFLSSLKPAVTIKDFLTPAAFGHLATVHEGQPFIDSNFFV